MMVDCLCGIVDSFGLEKDLVIYDNCGFGYGKFIEEFWECIVGKSLNVFIFVKDFLVQIMFLICQYCSIFGVIEKWDFYLCGIEFVIGYLELSDLVVQWERFVDQVCVVVVGDDEVMVFDEDFLVVLEYGMLLCIGIGMGIDWLLMFLIGLLIREIVLFLIV